MDKEFRLTSMSYRLNHLVDKAKQARMNDSAGTCKKCGALVSMYRGESKVLQEHRPQASSSFHWDACDNADCDNSYGAAHPAEWLVPAPPRDPG